MKLLITGMAGFIGHAVAEYFLKNTQYEIIGLDRLDFSGSLHRIKDIDGFDDYIDRISFVWHDLKSPINEIVYDKIKDVDLIFHLAACTHVDRAIASPVECVYDNVIGTLNLLEFARKQKDKPTFLYFSTDEVFGPAPNNYRHDEWDNYNSSNPYAAAKAGGEELCIAYSNTYGLKTIITHTMNVIGPRQHPEKFIPMCINRILFNQQILIHSSLDKTIAGSRFYIHTEDVASALEQIVNFVCINYSKFKCDKFNIVGPEEVFNDQVANDIANHLHKQAKLDYVDFHSSRPGHDLRYALCGEKLKSLGFKHKYNSWKTMIGSVVDWYINHQEWLNLKTMP